MTDNGKPEIRAAVLEMVADHIIEQAMEDPSHSLHAVVTKSQENTARLMATEDHTWSQAIRDHIVNEGRE